MLIRTSNTWDKLGHVKEPELSANAAKNMIPKRPRSNILIALVKTLRWKLGGTLSR